jgi:O-antigen/teichoic acid export membrane protein
MSLLNPIIGYFCVIYSTDRLMARISSMTLVSCSFYLIIYISIFRKGKLYFNKEYWMEALKVNVPLIPHYLSATILNQADRLMINDMVSSSAAGIYSVAYSAGMLIQIVVSSLNSSIVPWIYQKMKIGESRIVRSYINIVSVLLGVCVLAFTLLAPECMKVLGTEEYYEAIWIFPPLTLSVFYIYVYNLFANVELYFKKSIYITGASVLSAVINVGLNYLLIPGWGYMVAGYTTLFSYACYALFHYVCFKLILKKKQMESPIDCKITLLIAVVVSLCTLSVNFVYENAAIRYWLIIVIMIIAICCRKKIKNLFAFVKTNG